MMDCFGGGSMMGIPMLVSVLLFVLLVIAGIWLVVRVVNGRPRGASTVSNSSARGILEERFARGEIDRDEFEERRRTLGG